MTHLAKDSCNDKWNVQHSHCTNSGLNWWWGADTKRVTYRGLLILVDTSSGFELCGAIRTSAQVMRLGANQRHDVPRSKAPYQRVQCQRSHPGVMWWSILYRVCVYGTLRRDYRRIWNPSKIAIKNLICKFHAALFRPSICLSSYLLLPYLRFYFFKCAIDRWMVCSMHEKINWTKTYCRCGIDLSWTVSPILGHWNPALKRSIFDTVFF